MKPIYSNDSSFINALKKGKPEAFSQLVNTYHQRLCAYTYNLVGDYDDAEDIVQNVFIKIWKKRERLRDDLKLENYLYKAAYNGFVSAYRKRGKVLSLEKVHIEELSSLMQADSGNSLENLVKQVKKEIDNLPPKCRQSFLLSKREGLTNLEIAEHLNVSVKTVEGHITKAFGILRKNLDYQMGTILFLMLQGKFATTGK